MSSEHTTLSQRACNACKQGHRKCDKKLPNCTECVTKHKLCIYSEEALPRQYRNGQCIFRFQPYRPPSSPSSRNEEVFKVVPIPDEVHQEAIPLNTNLNQFPNTQVISFNIPRVLSASETHITDQTCDTMEAVLDTSINSIFPNIALLNRSKSISLVSMLNEMRIKQVCNMKVTVGNAPDIALLLAFQAWMSKHIQTNAARQNCFDIANRIVSGIFDQLLTSPSLAAAYCLMGVYLWDENETKRATFLLESVITYLRHHRATQPLSDSLEEQMERLRYGFLFFICDSTLSLSSSDPNLSILLKRILAAQYIMKTYTKLCTLWDGNESELIPSSAEEMEEFEHYQQMINSDFLASDNKHAFDLNSLDKITTKFQSKFANLQCPIYLLDSGNKLVTLMCLALGAKIQYFQSMDISDINERMTRQTADQISILMDNPTLTSHPFVTWAIRLAMKVHMKYLETEANVSERYKLLKLLKTDIRSIQQIALKVPYLTKRHEDITLSAQQLVQKIEESQRITPFESLINSWKLTANNNETPHCPRHTIAIANTTYSVTDSSSNESLTLMLDGQLEPFLEGFLNETNEENSLL